MLKGLNSQSERFKLSTTLLTSIRLAPSNSSRLFMSENVSVRMLENSVALSESVLYDMPSYRRFGILEACFGALTSLILFQKMLLLTGYGPSLLMKFCHLFDSY